MGTLYTSHQTRQQTTLTMAMSGVQLTEACMPLYDDIQKGKKYRYGIFHITWGKIDVEKIGERTNNYEDFLKDLLQKDGVKDDCRFAIYDYEYKFAPQGAEAQNKKKMLYSSSFDTLKKAFVGVHKVLQANGHDDVEMSEVEKILRATDRN